MSKASKRTILWLKDNPEKARINRKKSKAIKETLQTEALKAYKSGKSKSPSSAIRIFCSGCEHATKRGGRENFPKAPIFCKNKKCPLFAFRNGNPMLIKRGKKMNMESIRSHKGAIL